MNFAPAHSPFEENAPEFADVREAAALAAAGQRLDRAAAEAILARAAVERLARMAEDEAFSARALGALAQVLCTKEERE